MKMFSDFFGGGSGQNNTNNFGQIYDQGVAQQLMDSQDWKGAQDYNNLFPGMNEKGGMFSSMGGWGNALQGVGSLAQAYMGYQGLGQAQDQLDFNKDVFNRNIENQSKLTNARLEDRQRARVGSTGTGNAYGSYESLDSYMGKNRVDGSPIK